VRIEHKDFEAFLPHEYQKYILIPLYISEFVQYSFWNQNFRKAKWNADALTIFPIKNKEK